MRKPAAVIASARKRSTAPSSSNRQRGFSLLELVIVVVIIVVLASGVYLRYIELVVDAERAAFQGVLGWLQAGINMELSESLAQGSLQGIQRLEQTNPMALVAKIMEPPSNYLGELGPEEGAKVAPGHWYYDLGQRQLVYHVRYNRNLVGAEAVDGNRLIFQLKVVFRAADSRGRRAVRGVDLRPQQQAFWSTPLSFGRRPLQ